MKSALVTGAAGQDGILLSQMLLAEGYRVTGLIRPGTTASLLRSYAPQVAVIDCDLADRETLTSVITAVRPNEIYNLGGVSSIVESVNHPDMTHQVNVGAVETILAVMPHLDTDCRFVQAASGTVFEGSHDSPQDELTHRSPHTPYAVTKAETLELIAYARATLGLHASAAILYNHESPLRGRGFVTRRITEAAARIAAGIQDHVDLGNLEVSRDWGWAPDYVRGMQLMLRADAPEEFVLATGQMHELIDFLEVAFQAAGVEDWQGRVRTRDDLRRTTEPSVLCGQSAKAYRQLGWTHTKSFADIAVAMVEYDMRLITDPQALWHES